MTFFWFKVNGSIIFNTSLLYLFPNLTKDVGIFSLPDKWIPSAKAYGKYENVNMSPNSSEGVFLKSTCFKSYI